MNQNFKESGKHKLLATFAFAFMLSSSVMFGQNSNPQLLRKDDGAFAKNISKTNLKPQAVSENINQMLGLQSTYSFKKDHESTDKTGVKHEAYQAYYQQIPIDNAYVLLHSKNGKTTFMNGSVPEIQSLQAQSRITPEKAIDIAKKAYNVTQLVEEYPAEKVITFINQNGEEIPVLSYKFKLASATPLVLRNIYVDAQNGQIIKDINLIHHASGEDPETGHGKSLYYGDVTFNIEETENGYRLRDTENNIETYDARELKLNPYSGVISDEHEVISTSKDFSGVELSEFELTEVNTDLLEEGAKLRFQIYYPDGKSAYNSPQFEADELPKKFSLTSDLISINQEHPFKAHVLSHSGAVIDTLSSFELTLNEGVNTLEDDISSAEYLVSLTSNPTLDIHWGMEKVKQFYKETFDRDSYDNNHGLIRQYYNPPNNFAGQNVGMPNNAFALEAPFNIMVYGTGDGVMMGPLVAIDVAGHEYSHLVIGNNGKGGLIYQGEPGALNESFADIFGTAIEFYGSDNPNWDLGENVALMGTNLRSMSNPKNPGGLSQQPSTYEGPLWINPANLGYDNGGVHINSGIQNYWYYLLSEGGSGTNDNQDSFEVEGIGIDKATEIAYFNLMNYLTPYAKYKDAYIGAMEASKSLFDFPSHEYMQTAKAWYAVGVADNPEEFCSGVEVLTEIKGVFGDGSEEEDYANNSDCGWLIQPQGAEHISMEFTKLNTEKDVDKVLVYDGEDDTAPLLGEFSGNELPESLTSSNGSLFIKFYTDQVNKGEGQTGKTTEDDTDNSAGWEIRYTTGDLSVSANELNDGLKVYPNPAKDVFNIQSNLPEDLTMDIFDINGKKIYSDLKVTNGGNNFNISNLNSGVYLLKFESNGQKHTEKLIVQ